MEWFALPPHDDMWMWGASNGNWQYVVSYDIRRMVWGASAKRLGNIGPRFDFGYDFKTREQAEASCNMHAGRYEHPYL